MSFRILDQLLGQRIAGGCDHCDAYQTFDDDQGIYVLTVHHDDDCPILTPQTRSAS